MADYHNIGDMRMKYKEDHEALTDELFCQHPMEQFEAWFKEVNKCSRIQEPNAMCLATADKTGRPTARYVLLKGFGKEGFTFYSNYQSRKGQDLEENPKAALTFYWEPLNRQVRVEGIVKKIPEEESIIYFKSRPLSSQISAAASDQSAVVASRDVLKQRAKQIEESCNGVVEKPKHWGGYQLVPNRIEFWQGQSDRLHDRICFIYCHDTQVWESCRLCP